MDVSLLVGAGLLAGQWAVVAPWPVLVAAVASAVGLRARLSRPGFALFAAAALLAVARGRWSVEGFTDARERVVAALGAPCRCEARGRVRSSPVLYAPRATLGFESTAPAAPVLAWNARLDEVECPGRPVLRGIEARLYGPEVALARGDRVELVADLGAVELWRNDGLDDPTPRAARRAALVSGRAVDLLVTRRGRELGSFIDRARSHVRARIRATFIPASEPLARALVLGENDLDPEDDRAFRTSGLAHLLAVSGTHLVLAVLTVVGALRALLRRVPALAGRWDVGRFAAVVGVALAWAYADFAGGSGSALRAASMLSVTLSACALGRKPWGVRAFGLSMTLGALADPLAAFDVSFTLSLASTAGLMLLQRPLEAGLSGRRTEGGDGRARRGKSWWAPPVATTLAASVGCAPFILLLSPSLPVGGLFANLLAVPLGELAALPVCLAHAVLAPFPAVERGAALVGSGSLLLVRAIAKATSDLPWLALALPVPTSWQLAAVAATSAWAQGARGKATSIVLVGAAAILGLEGLAVRSGAPRGRLRITFLDVGQGDSALLDLPDGKAMLVDGGGALGGGLDPGRVVLAPLLRARRRRAVDLVVLTHPHPDHMGGLLAGLADVRVGEFWDNGQGETETLGPIHDALVASFAARGVPTRAPGDLCGAAREVGGARVRVLSPCPGPVPFADPNDNSIVLRVEYGRRAALLVGDAPFETEGVLLRHSRAWLAADVLKVGHHGSRTSSSSGFLEAVHPAYAVVSCGARNRFGHPHPSTMGRIEAGAILVRTDRSGSVTWETDGWGAWLRVAAGPAPR